MVVLKPNVIRGGRAIGLGNNLYLMKGRTHSKGGIDIGKNPKTGLEVENNEVMQVSPQGVRVFSAQPILGGISPAQYILGGANPNQVFNAQEQWKKVNKINDDGTKKARFGMPISPSPNIIQYAEGFGESLKNKNFAKKVVKFYKKHSSKIPDKVHKIVYDTLKDTAFGGNMSDIIHNVRHNIKNEVNDDNVFLMPQDRQQKALERLGYNRLEEDNYGLVNAAVQKYKEATGREVPIYQKGEDEITREELIPLDNADLYSPTGSFREVITPWSETGAETKVITDNEDIGDTANTPTRYYRDKNGNIYVKSWDFFDHGNYSRTDYNNEVRGGYVTRALTDLSQEFGNLLDEAGNPFVKTTGYKKVYPPKEPIVNGDIENKIVKEELKRYNDNKNSMSANLIRSIIGYDYFEKKYKGDVNKAIKDIFEGKYDTKKFGGRKIAQDGTERSRKKMFNNVTKQIKQIAKQEENRNTPLPIRGEKPINPLGYNIASYAPVVGDAIQLGEGISDIKNRNYIAGAINLGLLALPDVIQGPVKKGIQSAVRKYEIKHLPGYQLKSLMEGNPLEKQLSKQGTISVNSIKAQAGKASKVEQAVINKVLDSDSFAGQKAVDYNQFRKAVQDELITYDRTPDTRWADYGVNSLGLKQSEDLSHLRNIENYARSDRFEVVSTDTIGQARLWRDNVTGDILNWDGITQRYLAEHDVINAGPGLNTFTFSSPRIPIGNAKHYDANTLGHSRTYTTANEPDVLHVMESQSDWAQSKVYDKPSEQWEIEEWKEVNELMRKYIQEHPSNADWVYYDSNGNLSLPYNLDERLELDYPGITQYIDANLKPMPKTLVADNAMAERLHSDFTTRQIQENLRYAAERGQTKMRYPTRETAAKIEGYPKREKYFDVKGNDITNSNQKLFTYGEEVDKKIEKLQNERNKITSVQNWGLSSKNNERINEINQELMQLVSNNESKPLPGIIKKTVYDYEDILKKYTEFPKQYKKLFKDADVRTIIDKKGNSWYEIDVPKDYLNQEWQYKYGGIHIKPSKRGTFTAAAKKHGMSIQGFANKVLANKGKYSSSMVKKARFAKSVSKWKHKEFGGDMDFNYWITRDNIYKLGGRKKGAIGLYDIPYPTEEQVKQLMMDDIGLGISNRSQRIVNDVLKNNSRLSEPSLQNTIDRMDAVRTITSNQPTVKTNNPGFVAQNLANGIQTGINIAGNIGSYLINRDAIRRMRGPAAPLPLRAETLPTRVSTAAQEAALRENIAKQENLLAGNLSSSRSRLNATNQIRNQGIGLYNQLQERKGEIERELITRDKLNRQGIANQNIAQVNQWRNAAREFENKRIDLNSENTIQHLIQGPADAIAGERGFFDNLASNDRYRMTAFLEAIKNPDALKAMNSDEIKQLARRFGVRTSWLRSIGINI